MPKWAGEQERLRVWGVVLTPAGGTAAADQGGRRYTQEAPAAVRWEVPPVAAAVVASVRKLRGRQVGGTPAYNDKNVTKFANNRKKILHSCSYFSTTIVANLRI